MPDGFRAPCLRRCEKIGARMKARKRSPGFAKNFKGLLPALGAIANFFTPSEPERSPLMRAERAKLKSCKDDEMIAQGKRSAALG
jgi:hypothetical protein